MLDVGPGTTVQVLINDLALSGADPNFADQYCVVVNGKIENWDTVLTDGDNIVIFLPIDGG